MPLGDRLTFDSSRRRRNAFRGVVPWVQSVNQSSFFVVLLAVLCHDELSERERLHWIFSGSPASQIPLRPSRWLIHRHPRSGDSIISGVLQSEVSYLLSWLCRLQSAEQKAAAALLL